MLQIAGVHRHVIPARHEGVLDPSAAPVRNLVLRALPPSELGLIIDDLVPVRLTERESLARCGEPISAAYFPETSVVSLVFSAPDGERPADVVAIGCEGFVGLPLVLGGGPAQHDMVCRVGGRALVLDAAALQRALERGPSLRLALGRAGLELMQRMARGTACDRSHSVEQRLASLLLQLRDQVGADEFELTHEQVSRMLGVWRPRVTQGAGALRAARAIGYRRGRVRILDARALSAVSCGCFARAGEQLGAFRELPA
jgi:CRP-like cAMP-binding protein